MKQINYFKEENENIRKLFNLEEVLKFQLNHDIQIIRGGDFQYDCYIDKENYSSGLTPMGALVFGIKIYKEKNDK